MKIEKVNDNQIRCTLTSEDLANRHLKISELAYGTDKAKLLFRDMMQQANYEFGFEAENIPLMIEAIPVSADAIILVITKVEYPDELDTRFSKFSDMEEGYENSSYSDAENVIVEGADDILGLFQKISDEKKKADTKNGQSEAVPALSEDSSMPPGQEPDKNMSSPADVPIDLTKLFVFHRLDEVTRLASILKGFYEGENSLYKDTAAHKYYLVIHKSALSPEVFNKICNILSEYAHQEALSCATEAYFIEHLEIITRHKALQTLSQI